MRAATTVTVRRLRRSHRFCRLLGRVDDFRISSVPPGIVPYLEAEDGGEDDRDGETRERAGPLDGTVLPRRVDAEQIRTPDEYRLGRQDRTREDERCSPYSLVRRGVDRARPSQTSVRLVTG